MADIGWPATRGLNKPPDYKKRCRGPGTSRLWRFCENKVCAERDKSQNCRSVGAETDKYRDF